MKSKCYLEGRREQEQRGALGFFFWLQAAGFDCRGEG